MSLSTAVFDAVSDDLARLGVVLLRASSEAVVLIERQRNGAGGKGFSDRFMGNRKDCGAFLLVVADGFSDRLLLHEMGHALAWVMAGRPEGHDWGCYAGVLAGSCQDNRASRLGIAYAAHRGLPRSFADHEVGFGGESLDPVAAEHVAVWRVLAP